MWPTAIGMVHYVMVSSPLDHEVLRHLWIFSRLKSNESVTNPFTYIQMICTSKCFVMSVYGAIGTWIMFFLGDEDSHSTLDGSVVPLPAIIQMFLYPVSPSGLVYCVLASTIPHVYIRPRCPLNCIPPPYLSYNNCLLLLLLAPLAIPCPLPQTPQNNSTTSTTF